MTYDYPIWYIFISFLISGLLSFLFYRKNIKTSWRFAFMAFLRFLSLLIVFIALGNLLISTDVETKIKPKLVVAFDQSSSMLQNESDDVLQSVFSKINNSELSENFRISNIGFGKSVSSIDILEFDETRTNFENLEKKLDLLLSETDKVILISDGNINSGNSSVFNNKKKYSFDVVGVGDTVKNTTISITKINHNKKVIVRNNFPVELFVEVSNYSGDIKIEISEKNKVVYSDKFSILPNSELHQKYRHSIVMKSSKEGTYIYKVKLFLGTESNPETEKIFSVDFVRDRGVALIQYKYLNPDISLFNRKLLERNYIVMVSKNAISKTNLAKFDFAVVFDGILDNSNDIPVITVTSKPNKQIKNFRLIDTRMDKKYFKSYSINSKYKKVYIEAVNLWQLNLEEAKRGENNLDLFFDTLIEDVELLKYSDKFSVVFKDIYSSSENVVIKLINESSQIKSVDAKAEIEIKGKNQFFDFIEENGDYILNIGKLEPSSFACKIYVNSKVLKTIGFSVKDFDLEMLGKSQNVELLKMMVSNQNGVYYSLVNYTDMIDEISKESNNLISVKKEKKSLIEQWWILFLLPLILGGEWLSRKRNSLY